MKCILSNGTKINYSGLTKIVENDNINEEGENKMFVLFTDTDTDMTPNLAKEFGYNLIIMPYMIGNKEVKPYVDYQVFDDKKYYDLLRKGTIPKTNAISPYDYMTYFEPFFKEGKDILYVHFSSAMSGTFNAMNIALDELYEEYPDRKLYTIDTKGISALSLNIVKAVGDLYKQGKSLEEILAWADTEVDKYAIYFYADDLKFFGRSGRVSNFSAFMGNMFGVHPIIYIGEDGKMTTINKANGRKGSLKKMMEYVINLQDDIKKHRVIIAHTDALDLAELLGNMLKEQFGEDLEIEYGPVNPTIGAHCGPDCVGVSFHAIHR